MGLPISRSNAKPGGIAATSTCIPDTATGAARAKAAKKCPAQFLSRSRQRQAAGWYATFARRARSSVVRSSFPPYEAEHKQPGRGEHDCQPARDSDHPANCGHSPRSKMNGREKALFAPGQGQCEFVSEGKPQGKLHNARVTRQCRDASGRATGDVGVWLAELWCVG